ncbi:MAG: hypothetical protein ACYTHK_18660 [Planctomycetota bacterium]|jgi:hypothetical protein
MDKTSFWWTGLCHTGGGPSEFDRDGHKYYDFVTGKFGYEMLGKEAADVTLDGDYAEVSNKTGALSVAAWNKTGVSEHDCMYCHRADRTIMDNMPMNWVWRAATLRAKGNLKDSTGADVPAFAAAPTAGQGWLSGMTMAATPPGKPPMATTLDIDYGAGLASGSLTQKGNDLYVASSAITGSPKDFACWGCHNMADSKKRGRNWFDADSDVHYKAFNNLDDATPDNDIAPTESTACTVCHPGGMDGMKYNHNFGKGNANLGSVRNDTDFEGFRTCRECHAANSQVRHPDAPVPPDLMFHDARHTNVLSCEACHIPYKLLPADIMVDNSLSGATVSYKTNAFLSADPLDPAADDKSKWYPSFTWKKDSDGVMRVFPAKLLLSAWWGDWDQNGTPNDLSDDQIKPLPLWRVRGITKGAPLPGVADNNVNTEAEIRLYIDALRGDDVHGNQVAANPVLVKGGKVWHDDGQGGVAHFEYEGTGIHTESSHPFSVSHNVRSGSEAWGAAGCSDCHGGHDTPVFDRKILVDPFGPDGTPVYKTVRGILGLSPG